MDTLALQVSMADYFSTEVSQQVVSSNPRTTPRSFLTMDQIALIVGGTGGFGQGCAHTLASKGFAVVLSGRSISRGEACVREIRASGGKAHFVPCDITKRQDISDLHTGILRQFGRLDIAINSAGIVGDLGKTATTTQSNMDHVFTVNIYGVYLCMQEQIKIMLSNPDGCGGRIINISSIYGLRGCPWASLYAASKHAVVGMTKSAGAEYAKDRIYINALAPGIVPTELVASMNTEKNRPAADPELANLDFLSRYPVGRFGTVQDVARAVAYILDNDWLVGSVLELDGGWGAV